MNGPEQLVKEIMSEDVWRVDTEATLGEAREMMAAHGIHHVLVFNRHDLVAVLSDRDVISHLSPNLGTLAEHRHDADTLLRRVFRAASYHPVTVPIYATVAMAAGEMLKHKISCLPVMDADRGVVGIVTSRDLLRALHAMAVEEPDSS